MKIISDIRLYKSAPENEFGTVSFGKKKLNAIVKRIVMKLREKGFSLGDFDHLYIDFTTRDMAREIILSDKVDRYHPWYRYCDVHIEKDLYDKLGAEETYDHIIHGVSTVLTTCFATEDFDEKQILACVRQAVEEGEDMLMRFKEKTGAARKAVVYLRFLDTCRFSPLLRVYDTEDNLLFGTDLPETISLDYIGEIQVSAKKVTIKPRKNAFTVGQAPLVFMLV